MEDCGTHLNRGGEAMKPRRAIRILLLLDDPSGKLHLEIIENAAKTVDFVLVDTLQEADLVIINSRELYKEYLSFDKFKWYLLITDESEDLKICLPSNIVFVQRNLAAYWIKNFLLAAAIYINPDEIKVADSNLRFNAWGREPRQGAASGSRQLEQQCQRAEVVPVVA